MVVPLAKKNFSGDFFVLCLKGRRGGGRKSGEERQKSGWVERREFAKWKKQNEKRLPPPPRSRDRFPKGEKFPFFGGGTHFLLPSCSWRKTALFDSYFFPSLWPLFCCREEEEETRVLSPLEKKRRRSRVEGLMERDGKGGNRKGEV